MNRFWSKIAVGAPDACWEWQSKSKTKNGYGIAWADFGPGAKGHLAHRVAFFLANGRAPTPGLDIMHACDNRLCCNPAHLSEGTRRENMQDCARKGRTSRVARVQGADHYNTKLNESDVRDIRGWIADGFGYQPIAKLYDIRPEIVGDIIRRKTWRYVTDAPPSQASGSGSP